MVKTKLATRDHFAAVLSALLLFIASPGQWFVAPIMWIALVPLIRVCLANTVSVATAARLGFSCGLLYSTALLYWVVIALGRYGGLPLPVAILALLGLAAYMALYFAGFAAILSATKNRLPVAISAPIIWVGLDQVKAWLFTGFPWQDLGYSQFQTPLLIQIADLTGQAGVTFLIVMVNALAASFLCLDTSLFNTRKKFFSRLFSGLLALLLMISALVYGKIRLQQLGPLLSEAPTLTVAVMQGNIDQSEKWSADGKEKAVQTYLGLTAEAAATQPLDLAIWPETALPFFPTETQLLTKIQDFAALPSSPQILTGAPSYSVTNPGAVTYFNSALLITGDNDLGIMQRYDKQHLVPFGEYVPLQKLLGTLPIAHTMGNFSSGLSAAPLEGKKAKLGILICFESIFPSLARNRTASGADILINLTNDAWYGVSSAPYQQISMAVLRAVENRRSLARAANTGISCFIDPMGRIMEASPIFKQLFLVQNLPVLSGQSVFNRFGHAFQPVCLILLSLIILYGIVVHNRSSNHRLISRSHIIL